MGAVEATLLEVSQGSQALEGGGLNAFSQGYLLSEELLFTPQNLPAQLQIGAVLPEPDTGGAMLINL